MTLPKLTYCPAALIDKEPHEFLEVVFVYKGKPTEHIPPTVSEPVSDKDLFVALLAELDRQGDDQSTGVTFSHLPPVAAHLGDKYRRTTVLPDEVFRFQDGAKDAWGADRDDREALMHEVEDFLSRLKPPMFGVA